MSDHFNIELNYNKKQMPKIKGNQGRERREREGRAHVNDSFAVFRNDIAMIHGFSVQRTSLDAKTRLIQRQLHTTAVLWYDNKISGIGILTVVFSLHIDSKR